MDFSTNCNIRMIMMHALLALKTVRNVPMKLLVQNASTGLKQYKMVNVSVFQGILLTETHV